MGPDRSRPVGRPLLLAFFAGHEAGDLGWYWPVSAVVFLGVSPYLAA